MEKKNWARIARALVLGIGRLSRIIGNSAVAFKILLSASSQFQFCVSAFYFINCRSSCQRLRSPLTEQDHWQLCRALGVDILVLLEYAAMLRLGLWWWSKYALLGQLPNQRTNYFVACVRCILTPGFLNYQNSFIYKRLGFKPKTGARGWN